MTAQETTLIVPPVDDTARGDVELHRVTFVEADGTPMVTVVLMRDQGDTEALWVEDFTVNGIRVDGGKR